MSHSGKPTSEQRLDALSDRFRDSLSCEANKPDFRELDLGSPVSPLRSRQSGPTSSGLTATTTTTTTSSSSSSSGSVSGRTGQNPVGKRSDFGPSSHSGELSGSGGSSPTAGDSLRPRATDRTKKPGHTRSNSGASHPLVYSGQSHTQTQSSANSPALNVLPAGNICPSGKIVTTGMNPNRGPRSDVLGTGSGNYGHGSVMRGYLAPKNANSTNSLSSGGVEYVRKAMGSVDPEEVKRAGNDLYSTGHLAEALSLYDRAIVLSPDNAVYRNNRAAALTRLGRLGEALRECEEAVRLDPNYKRAQQRLGYLFLRWVMGQVEFFRIFD